MSFRTFKITLWGTLENSSIRLLLPFLEPHGRTCEEPQITGKAGIGSCRRRGSEISLGDVISSHYMGQSVVCVGASAADPINSCRGGSGWRTGDTGLVIFRGGDYPRELEAKVGQLPAVESPNEAQRRSVFHKLRGSG